jgi:hypothetical protein
MNCLSNLAHIQRLIGDADKAAPLMAEYLATARTFRDTSFYKFMVKAEVRNNLLSGDFENTRSLLPSRSCATSSSDSESGSEAGSQSSVFRSHYHRFVHEIGLCTSTKPPILRDFQRSTGCDNFVNAPP